ncbi:hypothetical protein BLNAU_9518 [Blattamonas nauphoetae]|uniref:Uncharacterized protein n=1 Tax=Blattamonas nauphoetae TaxID=2049346 RepID=A0ABQ9XVI2_9EUKA|nr:hypothetical protein BLNAU_9518 [Blattamonas nauphoetae]
MFIDFTDTVCVPVWHVDDSSPDDEREILTLSLAILERESLVCALIGHSSRVLDHLFTAVPDDPIDRFEVIARTAITSQHSSRKFQVISHIPRILHAHPDLITRLLDTNLLIQLFSTCCTYYYHISSGRTTILNTLSHSPPQLVTKLDSVCPAEIRNIVLLAHRFETSDISIPILFRLIENHPNCLTYLTERTVTPIESSILEYVCNTLRVLSDHPDQPRCLCFGRDTSVLKIILGQRSTGITQDQQKLDDTHRLYSLIPLLILCTASSDDDLSTEALTVATSFFQLPVSQTVALLHHTPPIISLPPDWPFAPDEQEEETRIRALSMGAYSGALINRVPIHAQLLPDSKYTFSETLRAATPQHSLPQTALFSSLIQPTQEEREMWNDPAHPSTLSHLQSLVQCVFSAKISVLFGFPPPKPSWKAELSTTLANTLRLIQLTQPYWSCPPDERVRLSQIILEAMTVDPFDISPDLVTWAQCIVRELLNPPRTDDEKCLSDFTESLRRRMGEAEGDERWRVFVQLCVVSDDVMAETMQMLVLAETNRRSLLTLTTTTPQDLNWTPETSKVMEESTRRLVCLAAQTEDEELFETVWRWLEKTHRLTSMEETHRPTSNPYWIHLGPPSETDPEMEEAILRVLERMVERRREGVGDGEMVGVDQGTADVVVACLHVLGVQLERKTLNAAPFLPVLASLALTTDFGVLFPLLDVFAIISETTEDSPSPFTLSTITIPFLAPSDAHPQPRSLLFIFSSILLQTAIKLADSDYLDEFNRYLSEQPPNPLTIPIVNEIARQANDLIVLSLAQLRHDSLLLSPMTSDSSSQPTLKQIVSAVICLVSSFFTYFYTLLNHFLPHDFSRFLLFSLRQMDVEDELFRFAYQFLHSFNSHLTDFTAKSHSCQFLQSISLIFTRSEHSLRIPFSSMSHLTNFPNPFPADLHPTFVAFREEGLEDMIEKTDDSELWRMLKQFGANCPAEVCFTPHTVPRHLMYMEHADEEELIHRLMDFEREETEGWFADFDDGD